MATITISTNDLNNRFLMTDEEIKKFFEFIEEEAQEKGHVVKYTKSLSVDGFSESFVNDLVSYFYFDVLKKHIDLNKGVYPDYFITVDVIGDIVEQYKYDDIQMEKTAIDRVNNAVYPRTDMAELNNIAKRYAIEE